MRLRQLMLDVISRKLEYLYACFYVLSRAVLSFLALGVSLYPYPVHILSPLLHSPVRRFFGALQVQSRSWSLARQFSSSIARKLNHAV